MFGKILWYSFLIYMTLVFSNVIIQMSEFINYWDEAKKLMNCSHCKKSRKNDLIAGTWRREDLAVW